MRCTSAPPDEYDWPCPAAMRPYLNLLWPLVIDRWTTTSVTWNGSLRCCVSRSRRKTCLSRWRRRASTRELDAWTSNSPTTNRCKGQSRTPAFSWHSWMSPRYGVKKIPWPRSKRAVYQLFPPGPNPGVMVPHSTPSVSLRKKIPTTLILPS